MRPDAGPPPAKPSGRLALSPKLATTFIVPSVTTTVPPPVTMATVSWLITGVTDGPAESGSTRPCAISVDNARTPDATIADATNHRDRLRYRDATFCMSDDLPPC